MVAALSFLALWFLGVAPPDEERLWTALSLEKEAATAFASRDWDTVIDRCTRGAALYHDLGAVQAAAACLMAVGWAQKEKGDLPASREALVKSLSLYQESGGHAQREVQITVLLGGIDPSPERVREAVRALAMAPPSMRLSLLFAAVGPPVKGRALYEAAVAMYRERRAKLDLANALLMATRIYTTRNEHDKAAASLEEAAAIYRKLNDWEGEAVALNDLALLYFDRGQIDQPLALLERTLSLLERSGSREGAILGLVHTAHLYANLGRFEESLERYEQALALARELDDPYQEAKVVRDLAQVLLIANRPEKALIQIRETLQSVRRAGNRSVEMSLLKAKAAVLLSMGRYKPALAAIDQSRTLSRRLGDRGSEAEVLLLKGMNLFARGRFGSALKGLQASLRIQEETGSLWLRLSTLLMFGASQESLGRIPEAARTYREAMELGESLLQGVQTDDLLLGLTKSVGLEHHRLLGLLAREGNAEEAFSVAERARARTLLRQIGSRRIDFRQGGDPGLVAEEGELRVRLSQLKRQIGEEQRKDFDRRDRILLERLEREADAGRRRYETLLIRLKQTHPEHASIVQPSPLKASDTQSLLDEKTTLIEFFVLDQETLAWVIDREAVRMVRLPVPARDLGRRITSVRERIAARISEAGEATGLYRDLIAPLEPHIRGRRLFIVPHGPLHFLPFAALLDGEGRRLVERYPLSQLPSASVLPFLSRKRSPDHGRLLVLGDPDGSLPHAAEEARAVAALYGARPLLGSRATEVVLREHGRPIDVLHIAAHAVTDPARPLFSRIELAPGGGEDGDLEVHEIFGLDLTGTNLVVLSGCETALGNLTEGDDLVGWSRAFLYAGAPAVLTTLWPVDDAASAALLTRFHRHLRQGRSTEMALQAAQREMLAEERWRSPYYWAAFVLTGDGR